MKAPDITRTELCVELTRIRNQIDRLIPVDSKDALTIVVMPIDLLTAIHDLFRLQIRCADAAVIR